MTGIPHLFVGGTAGTPRGWIPCKLLCFLGILGGYDHVENPCLETRILDGIPTQTGDMTGVGMEQLADTGAA